MMKKIATPTYDVLFTSETYEELGAYLKQQDYSKIFIITDSNTHEYCLPHFLALLPTEIPFEIIEIEPGEANKNIQTCISIWEVLSELQADRRSVILNVGGGVVTDLGGFIASTFKRGLDHIQIPTSLLAMVDASIGGKTGIDLQGIKNQIGTFSDPKMVLVDVTYLQSLPSRELRAGYAEMLKHALIYDSSYWEVLKDTSSIDFNDLEDLIFHSIYIKDQIVREDPKELGIRKALNFGHTLGHALESHFLTKSDQEILLHGEAIAIGMVLESYLSYQTGTLPKEAYEQIKSVITAIFPAIAMDRQDQQAVKLWLKHDKKSVKNEVQFVLLNGIGNFKINQPISETHIDQAFEEYLD